MSDSCQSPFDPFASSPSPSPPPSSSLLLLLLLVGCASVIVAQQQQTQQQQQQPPSSRSSSHQYVYALYHNKDQCQDDAVSIKGFTSGNNCTVLGAESSSSSSCSVDTLCLLDETSTQCLALNHTVEAVANFTVNENGDIQECDSSNEAIGIEECTTHDKLYCEQSSVYPDCHFQEMLLPDIIDNPNLLKNSFAGNNNGSTGSNGVAETVYLMFYSDDQCRSLSGLSGHPSGNNFNITMLRNAETDGIDCTEAMACLLTPDGDSCQALNPTGTVEVNLESRNNGREAYGCDDENVCKQRNPDDCVPSTIYPTCYHRVVPGILLFENPAGYIQGFNTTSSGDNSNNTNATGNNDDSSSTPTSGGISKNQLGVPGTVSMVFMLLVGFLVMEFQLLTSKYKSCTV